MGSISLVVYCALAVNYLDRKTEHRRRNSSTTLKTKYECCVEKEGRKRNRQKEKRRKGTAQASWLNSQAIQPTGPAVASPPFSRFLVMSFFSCAGTRRQEPSVSGGLVIRPVNTLKPPAEANLPA